MFSALGDVYNEFSKNSIKTKTRHDFIPFIGGNGFYIGTTLLTSHCTKRAFIILPF